MKAEELRIGNLISIDITHDLTKDCEVIGITDIHGYEIALMTKGGNQYNVKELSLNPIPLTPSWLEIMGFKNEESLYCDGKMCIHFEDEKYILSIGHDSLVIEIKYVHTLQNLYYYLTNSKEIKVKELEEI